MSFTIRDPQEIWEELGWTEEKYFEWFEGLSMRAMGTDGEDHVLTRDTPDCVFLLPGCHKEEGYTDEDKETWSKLDLSYFRPEWACGNCHSIFWKPMPEDWQAEDVTSPIDPRAENLDEHGNFVLKPEGF